MSAIAAGRTAASPRGAGIDARPLLPAVGVVGAVLLWWLATDVVFAARPLVAQFSPLLAVRGFAELAAGGALLDAASASVFRLLAGVAVAAVIGVAIGLAVGSSRSLDRAVSPVLLFLRMVSPLSWAPVVVIAFGVGDPPVVALVAAAAVWPIATGVAEGVGRVNPGHLGVASSLGASRAEVLSRVTWPSVRPALLLGVRQALGIAWVVLVPAEMLGVASGLGYEILNAKDQLAFHHVTALILVIGTLGFLIDVVARWLLATRRDRSRGAAQ